MHPHPVKQPNLTRKFPLTDMPTGPLWLGDLTLDLAVRRCQLAGDELVYDISMLRGHGYRRDQHHADQRWNLVRSFSLASAPGGEPSTGRATTARAHKRRSGRP